MSMMDQYLADLHGEDGGLAAFDADCEAGSDDEKPLTVLKKPAGVAMKRPASNVMKRPASALQQEADDDADYDIQYNEKGEEVRDRIKARKFEKLMAFDQIPSYIKDEYDKVGTILTTAFV